MSPSKAGIPSDRRPLLGAPAVALRDREKLFPAPRAGREDPNRVWACRGAGAPGPGVHPSLRGAGAQQAAEGRSSPRAEPGLGPSASRAEGDGKPPTPEESLLGACFGALHKPGCQPRAHRRESVGPAAAGEGEVGEEGAMHPEARAGGGRDTGATRDASGGGPLPSPTGERGRASGRSSPAPTTTLRATAAAKAQVTPRQGLSAGAALQSAAPARRAHGTGSLCPLRGRPPHASQHPVLSARGQTAAGQGRGPGSPPCGGPRPGLWSAAYASGASARTPPRNWALGPAAAPARLPPGPGSPEMALAEVQPRAE